jgi:hypothetical protein
MPITSEKILCRWKGLAPNRSPRPWSVIFEVEFSLM